MKKKESPTEERERLLRQVRKFIAVVAQRMYKRQPTEISLALKKPLQTFANF